jgi:hypothetical protein
VPPNPKKIEVLRSSGTLNRHPQKVRHPLFAEHDFFDPNDMVQHKPGNGFLPARCLKYSG